MNLKTNYLGLELSHPLMPGASPLSADRDSVRRLEDAGASAVVLSSLFEEQLEQEESASARYLDAHEYSTAEASTFAPSLTRDVFRLGPEEYLEHLRWMKSSLSVPVIGSLNGTSRGGWLEYAVLMEQAGANALELNLYEMACDPTESGSGKELHVLDIVKAVKSQVKIPVAVKLSPFYSSLPHFASLLQEAGADGLVLFNRFYQADVDIENLEVTRGLQLSDPSELLLRLRWLAVLSASYQGSLAATGGVHHVQDVIKAVMCGAHAVQVVSALLQKGPLHLSTLRTDLTRWLEENEYESLEQMCGSMNLARCPNPREYERTNYVQILQTWEA